MKLIFVLTSTLLISGCVPAVDFILLNNTGNDFSVLGCGDDNSINSGAMLELGGCGDEFSIKLTTGRIFSYEHFPRSYISHRGAYEKYTEYKMFSLRGIVKLQVNSNGEIFVMNKGADMPVLEFPEQPPGFPLLPISTK